MDRSPSAENRAPCSYESAYGKETSPILVKQGNGVERRFSSGTSKSVLYSPEVSYRKEKEARRKNNTVSPSKRNAAELAKSSATLEKKKVEDAITRERRKLEDIPRQHQEEYDSLLLSETVKSQYRKSPSKHDVSDVTYLGTQSFAIPISEDALCHEYKSILAKLENVAKERENSVVASGVIESVNLNMSHIENEIKLTEQRFRENNTMTVLDDAGYAVPQILEDKDKSAILSEEFRSPFDSPSKLNDSTNTPTNRMSAEEMFFTPMVDKKSKTVERNLITHQVEKASNTLKRMTNEDKHDLENATWRSPQKKIQGDPIPEFEDYRQSMPINSNLHNCNEARSSLPEVARKLNENSTTPLKNSLQRTSTEHDEKESFANKEDALIRPRALGAQLSAQINYSAQINNMEEHLETAKKINDDFNANNSNDKTDLNMSSKLGNQDIDELLDGIELFESTLIEPVLVPKKRVKTSPLSSITEDAAEIKHTSQNKVHHQSVPAEAAKVRRCAPYLQKSIEKYCNDVRTLEKLELRKLQVYKKLGLCQSELKSMESDVRVMSDSMIVDANMWIKIGIGKDILDQRCKQLAKMYSKVSVEIKLLASLLSQKFEVGTQSPKPVSTATMINHIEDTVKEEKQLRDIAVGSDSILHMEPDIKCEDLMSSRDIKQETSEESDQDEGLEEPILEEQTEYLPIFSSEEFNMNNLDGQSEAPEISSTPIVPPLNLSSLLDEETPEYSSQRKETEKANTSLSKDSFLLNDSDMNNSRLNTSERSEGKKNMAERFMAVSPKTSPQIPSRQFPTYSLDFTFNDSRIFNDILSPTKFNNSVDLKCREDDDITPKKQGTTSPNRMPEFNSAKPISLLPDFMLNESEEDLEDFLGVCTSKTKKDDTVILSKDTGSDTILSAAVHYPVIEKNVTEIFNGVDKTFDLEESMKSIRSEEWITKTIVELSNIVWNKRNEPGFDGFAEIDVFDSFNDLKADVPFKHFTSDDRLQAMHDEMRILYYASVLNVAADLWPKQNESGLFGLPKPSLYVTDKRPESVTYQEFTQACLKKIIKSKDMYYLTGRIFKNDSDPEKMAFQLLYCDRGFLDESITRRVRELEGQVVDNITDAVEAEIVDSLFRDDKTDEHSNSMFGSFSNSSFFSQGLIEGRFSIGRRSSITRESLSKRTPSPLVLAKIEE